MKFSIVIPNITKTDDNFALLKNCIKTFFEHHASHPFLSEVIVVDDGSSANYQSKIKDFLMAYPVKFIPKEKNEGFSVTVNTGIRASSGDVVLLVNNDISFTESLISKMAIDFSDDRVGIVGCLLFYPNGTIQHGGICRIGTAFTHLGWHKRIEVAPEAKGQKFLIGVTGAMFAIRRKMIDQVGIFDETFFMSCEDTQLCIRAWMGGWKVKYDGDISAIHIEGGTRGSATTEKLSKSLDTRNWYLQELKTSQKFQDWLKSVDLLSVDRKVNEANLSMTRMPMQAKSDTIECPVVAEHIEVHPKAKVIGIIRTGALGDVLMATPVIRALKNKFPDKEIWFATRSPAALAGNPYVSRVVQDGRALSSVTDVIYDLDLAYESRPKMHATDAYSHVVFGHGIEDKRIDFSSNQLDGISHMIPEVNFSRDKVVVLHMATSWANRTWPKTSWASVTQTLATRGYKIIVIGSGGDMRANLMSGVINLVDKLNLSQIRELIKSAKAFIGPDSGLMHIAQTTDTPVIGIFTVASPDYRVTRRDKFIALVPTSQCRFCLHEERPPVTFVGCKVGTMQCLQEITPAMVLRALDEVML